MPVCCQGPSSYRERPQHFPSHDFCQDLDLDKFEELFKTKAQGPALDLICSKNKTAQKAASKVTLLEANRAKNLAITLRKAGRSAEEICRAIHT